MTEYQVDKAVEEILERYPLPSISSKVGESGMDLIKSLMALTYVIGYWDGRDREFSNIKNLSVFDRVFCKRKI